MIRKNKKETSKQNTDVNKLHLANMSHELRTPMNAIVGLADILVNKATDFEEKEYLDSMKTATSNLLMTVNNILDFESMLDGEMELNEDSFCIYELIKEVAAIARINIQKANVKIIVDVEPDLPSLLRGDSGRIKQILVHLISNAIKFTEKGYIVLSVKGQTEEENCRLYFTVEDTGRGIPADKMDSIFVPYVQGDATSSRKEGGLGIGLTIANAIVEAMGSKMNVKSEEGKGTSFEFDVSMKVEDKSLFTEVKEPGQKNIAVFLPDKKEEATLCKLLDAIGVSHVCINNMGEVFIEHQKKKVTHVVLENSKYIQVKDVTELKDLGIAFINVFDTIRQSANGANTYNVRRPLWYGELLPALNNEGIDNANSSVNSKEILFAPEARALIVDDNDINLKVIRGLLKPYGLTIDAATSAAEGISLIKKNRYDIVYMDYMMPEMDGVEATKTLRSIDDPYIASLPIVAVSANAIPGIEETFMAAGMNGYIPKPVSVQELEDSLKKWLPKEKISTSAVAEKETGIDLATFRGFKKIDIQVGLSYTNGNSEMYHSLVKDIAATISEKRELINRLVKEEDIGRFTIEVHSLKSSAKTLGAGELSEKAMELEKYGHARNLEAIKERIDLLNREIDAVIEDLKPFKEEKDEIVNRIPIDREKVRDSLRNLFYAADDFDYDKARNIIAEIGKYQFKPQIEEIYKRIHDSIEDIDYDEARKGAIEMLIYI